MTPEQAGASLSVDEDHEDFWEQLFLITRMGTDPAFTEEVKKHFKPTYK